MTGANEKLKNSKNNLSSELDIAHADVRKATSQITEMGSKHKAEIDRYIANAESDKQAAEDAHGKLQGEIFNLKQQIESKEQAATKVRKDYLDKLKEIDRDHKNTIESHKKTEESL